MSRRHTWIELPLRICNSLHDCNICGKSIHPGDQYRDGGKRKAHAECATDWEALLAKAQYGDVALEEDGL